MRNNTDRKKGRLGAVLSAAVMVVFLAGILLVLIYTLTDLGSEEGAAIGVLVGYGLLILAMIVGVAAALVQRLRELDRGEEEDAKKY